MHPSIGLTVVAAVLVAACGAPPPPAASPPIATTATGAQRCRLTVTDTEGCQPAEVEALVEPVRARIEHCRGASGGKVTIRVRRDPGARGRLAFDVAPGTSLDPTERKCVLDALNALQENESSTAWTGGAAIPPSGFSSLLTIEW